MLGLKDPRLSKLDELKLPGFARSRPIGKIMARLEKQGKLTPAALLSEIKRISGGEESVLKTSFGYNSDASRGVYGVKDSLSLKELRSAIGKYKRGTGTGLFIQTKLPLHYGELRAHVAVDDKGRVKLIKGGTILKATGLDPASKTSVKAFVDAGLSESEATKAASSF